MSDIIRIRQWPEIEEEAAVWVWRLDEEPVAEEVRAQFEEWLRRDPRHRRAFEELGGVWKALDAWAEAETGRDEPDETVIPFVAPREQPRVRKSDAGNPRRLAPWAMAASVAVVAVVFAVMFWFQRGNETQTLATAIGQRQTVALSDGSSVVLNTDTVLETRFDRGERVVRLRKGEASFTVAHDAGRPFFVRAGDAEVRAIGTQFNVRVRDRGDIEVVVAEGRVQVESGKQYQGATTAREPTRRILQAGQKVDTAMAMMPVIAINPTAMANLLAWHEGAVVFDGEPLSQAVAELNRYTDTRLVITDREVDAMRIGGRFKTGDVEGFLQAMTKALPVRIRRVSDRLVYIERRT